MESKVKTPFASMVAAHKIAPGMDNQDDVIRADVYNCILTVLRVFTLFGFKAEGYRLEGTVRHWLQMCIAVGGIDPWLKVAKYKTAQYFAYHQGQPLALPPFPLPQPFADHPGILLGGRAYRWQKQMLDSKRRDEFLTSLLYVKKGMPRPSLEYLRQAEEQAQEKLTTMKPPFVSVRLVDNWADINELNRFQDDVLTRDRIDEQLRRTVRELFEGKTYSIQHRIKPFTLSTSANYIRSRGKAGAIGGVLLERPDLLGYRQIGAKAVEFKSRVSGLPSIIGSPVGVCPDEIAPLYTVNNNSITFEGNESFDMRVGWEVDTSEGDDRFAKFYWRVVNAALEERPLVEPLALAEALKARVISKGPYLLYTAMKPLQKFMWTVLKEHPTFKLIGTPVTAEIVQKALGEKLSKSDGYLSGDYRDATNEVESWASDVVAGQISDELFLSGTERELFQRSLTGHEFLPTKTTVRKPVPPPERKYDPINPPENWEDLVDEIKYVEEEIEVKNIQRSGQLMGSVTSFPVLCIINAAMARYAIEQDTGRKHTLAQCPLLINGDDIAARMSVRSGYTLWKRCLSAVGLQESLGKTYFSREFVNINSTNFRRLEEPVFAFPPEDDFDQFGVPLVPAQRPIFFQQIAYVNLGLLFGMKRSGAAVSKRDVFSVDNTLGARARELYRSCPAELRDEVMTAFVHYHFHILSKLRVPWFAPEWLGGVGLPSFTNTVSQKVMGPTRVDLHKSAGIRLNWAKKRPMHGTKVNWMMHSLALSRMPEKADVELSDEEANEYDAVYGRIVAGLIFDGFLVLEDLFSKKGQTNEMRALRHNERLWLSAPFVAGDPEELLKAFSSARPAERGILVSVRNKPLFSRRLGNSFGNFYRALPSL